MPKPVNPLEDLLDELRDRALDWVEDLLEGSTERLKGRVRDIGPRPAPRPVQGRRKRVQGGQGASQGASTGQKRASRPTPPPKPLRTAYTVLGVTPDAEPEVLAAAFKAKVKLYHPDTSKNPKATELMTELGLAWAILKDPEKRKEYDRRMGL